MPSPADMTGLEPPRAAPGAQATIGRLKLTVRGRVQGVGFRPTVHRVASRLGLVGHVRNGAEGVLIEIEGERPEAFERALRLALPPLARLDSILSERLRPLRREAGFVIRESVDGEGASAIPADAAICRACLAEMFDPSDRRWRHAFIACTDCGPRFTMTKGLPYDRPRTTMGRFPLCERCEVEYEDPADRRFHAEAIACPHCGPKLSADIADIAADLKAGRIVALKGLGGYHLACDARNEAAVAALRARKKRDGKPFAVMVAGLGGARALAELAPRHEAALTRHERPIVIAPGKAGSGLANGVTQGLPTIGLFLPATPLQALIFHELAGRPAGLAWMEACEAALVMTSANLSGEPIVADDDEARAALAGIADRIVSHDREILVRCDDSVLAFTGAAPALIRRARGYAPDPVALKRSLPSALGLGAHLKTTVAVIERDRAVLSAHIGDLDSPAGIAAHQEATRHLIGLTRAKPRIVAHDLHPDLATTRLAAAFGLPAHAVQHHHAHALAVAAEHGVERGFLGLILDGVGYGPGGAIWGGELLAVDGPRSERVGHLSELALPGGDVAAREPWRVAAGVLAALGRSDEIPVRFPDQPQAAALAANLARMASPMTSSAGRLFDAAAALLGVAARNRFEGEAAMRLEALVRRPRHEDGLWRIEDGRLDLSPCSPAWPTSATRSPARSCSMARWSRGWSR